ncbi:MAG: hypothetical protein SynsKO_03230 [Synoicihabitans sp.]
MHEGFSRMLIVIFRNILARIEEKMSATPAPNLGNPPATDAPAVNRAGRGQ